MCHSSRAKEQLTCVYDTSADTSQVTFGEGTNELSRVCVGDVWHSYATYLLVFSSAVFSFGCGEDNTEIVTQSVEAPAGNALLFNAEEKDAVEVTSMRALELGMGAEKILPSRAGFESIVTYGAIFRNGGL